MMRTTEDEAADVALGARGRTATRAIAATGGTRMAVAAVAEEAREVVKTARRGPAEETVVEGTGRSRGLGRRVGEGAEAARCTRCARFRRAARGGTVLEKRRRDRRWPRKSWFLQLAKAQTAESLLLSVESLAKKPRSSNNASSRPRQRERASTSSVSRKTSLGRESRSRGG